MEKQTKTIKCKKDETIHSDMKTAAVQKMIYLVKHNSTTCCYIFFLRINQ